MKFLLLAALLTPVEWQVWMHSICSELHVKDTLKLLVVREETTDYAWIQYDTIYVTEWTYANADRDFIEYLLYHEVCHYALGHSYVNGSDRIEVDADNCVKLYAGDRWQRFDASIVRMNEKARRHLDKSAH